MGARKSNNATAVSSVHNRMEVDPFITGKSNSVMGFQSWLCVKGIRGHWTALKQDCAAP